MALRTTVEMRRRALRSLRLQVARKGWANAAEQKVLLGECADDACIVGLLTWLVREIGMPVADVIKSIKTTSPGHPRPEALALARIQGTQLHIPEQNHRTIVLDQKVAVP